MAQHDYVIANGTGAAVRSDLNNALAAIVSQNSGATEPATTYAYQWWADTTTNLLKLRNAANSAWITLFQLDGEWSTIALENGSASAPSIYFKDSGTDTGLYSPGTDQVGLSTGGTARLTIDSNGNVAIDTNTLYVDATNNRVGLGDSAPKNALDCSGNIGIAPTAGLTSNLYYSGGWKYKTTGYGTVLAQGTGGFKLSGTPTSGSADGAATVNDWVTITNGGAVGIGTTAASTRLHVSQTGSTQAVLVETDQSASVINFKSTGQSSGQPQVGCAGSDMIMLTNGAERGRWDSNGRFLVGTSTSVENVGGNLQVNGGAATISTFVANSAAYRLYFVKSRSGTFNGKAIVQSGDDLGRISFNGDDGVDYSSEAASIACQVDGTPGADDMPGRLVFSTCPDSGSSPVERMRITSSGATLFGNTQESPAFSNVNGTSIKQSVTEISRLDGIPLYLNRGTSDGILVGIYRSAAFVGSISVTTTATAYNTSSDYRLKENVVPLTGASDRLNQLQVHRFNFIADPDTTVDGFIAHEAQAVVPECVTGTKDEVDADGNPVYQGIDQSKLVPLLTAALQEAIGRIETLEAEVTALKGA